MNESQKLREHHQTHLIKEDYRKTNKERKYHILFMHQEGGKTLNVVVNVLPPEQRQ